MFNQEQKSSKDPITLDDVYYRVGTLVDIMVTSREQQYQISVYKGKIADLELENKLLKKQYEDLFKLFEGALKNA
jgi:hypothetical protein